MREVEGDGAAGGAQPAELPVLDARAAAWAASSSAQIVDLVQEERCRRGRARRQPMRYGATAPVKAPLLVAEQLALDQRRRDRAAVEHHERALHPRRQLVQALGGQLLADPGLAGDQRGGVRHRQLLDAGEQLAHLDRAADHAAQPVAVGDLELDRLAQRLEPQPGRADRDLRARLDVDVVDAQARDERPVGRVEIAQAVAAVRRAGSRSAGPTPWRRTAGRRCRGGRRCG